MGTYFSRDDLSRLRALREVLIGIEDRPDGTDAPRYWSDARDLELYDRVFAARIGWKWDSVLDEVHRRAGLGAPRTVVDWAAGTGVATRAVLGRLGEMPERVVLVDRDRGAREYAAASVREAFPGVTVECAAEAPEEEFDLCLASHVLDELDGQSLAALHGVFRRAARVLWVEPGSKATARRLSKSRDALLDRFDVIAPCTHREACGMLAPERGRDWCHHFAAPPAFVHTTGEWGEIGRELGIDLRSLPYSFLALNARPVEHDPALVRRLGRPRSQRGRTLVDVCDAAGVREEQLLQRDDKDLFKRLKKTFWAAPLLRREESGQLAEER